MFNPPLLSIIICLPLISCFFVLISKDDELQNAKLSALCGSFIVLLTSITLLCLFDFAKDTVQFIEEYVWIPGCNIKYKVGLDKFSLFFVLMIAVISFLCMIWLLKKHIHKTKHFFASILLFESFAIGAFVSYDMFLLLFFMEATMIPLFVMMYTSDKEGIKNTVLQFFAYGMAGALCIMIAMLMIYNEKGTADILKLQQSGFIKNTVCFWILFLGVAIKTPMFPVNYWLPRVHVEAPTVCSVLLGAVMLKFSSLVTVKILYRMFFNTFSNYHGIISIICLISALTACANIFFEKDLKRIFAYFSILHMNIYYLILLSKCELKQFVFAVLYHSFLISILFFIADIIKTVFKTRNIQELKNIKSHFMKVKRLMLFATLCLIGAPLTWGFITEIIALYSASTLSNRVTGMVAVILMLSSVRAFYVYQSVFELWQTNTINSIDMFQISNASKNIVLYTLFAIILFVGVFNIIFL